MVSVYCAMLECDGIWRAWEESMECWFFSHRSFNASIWEWWLQGIWTLILVNYVLFPNLRKKNLVIFLKYRVPKSLEVILGPGWVDHSFFTQLTAEMIVVSDGHSEY